MRGGGGRREGGERERKINNSSKIAERCTFSRKGRTGNEYFNEEFIAKKLLWSFSISSSSHLTLIYPTCGCRWRIVSSGGNNENVGKEDREGKGRRMEEKCDGKSNYAEYETWGKTAWCTCDSYEPDVCKINFPLEDVSRRESRENEIRCLKKKKRKRRRSRWINF